MTKTVFLKVLISSYAESLLFLFSGVLTILQPFQELSIRQQIVCCICCAFLTIIGYGGIIYKFNQHKTVLKVTVFYAVMCVIFLFLNYVIYSNFIDLPLVETNSANGLIILFSDILFILVADILKVSLIILNAIRIKKLNNRQSGDS